MRTFLHTILDRWQRSGAAGANPVNLELDKLSPGKRRRAFKEVNKNEKWGRVNLKALTMEKLRKLHKRAHAWDAPELAAAIELEIKRRILK